MAIYFSEKFKQYRKAKDLTQEQLADIFHVSPQAVSRWETGATCPDIALLPSIAAYFKITVDELLGVDKIKDKERIGEIIEVLHDKWNSGHMVEAEEILRDAVREFPHEHEFQLSLALTMKQKAEADEEKKKKNILEAIAIAERVLENCTDDEIRNRALFNLSQSYKEVGEKEKAVETAKKLPCAAGSSDVVLTTIYEGDELHHHLKKNISHFTGFLAEGIHKLAYSMYDSSSDERIKLIKKAIGVYELIYEDGDYGFKNFFLSQNYCYLAGGYYNTKDMENALDCWEKAAQHAIDFDTTTDLIHHTSLAVQGMENKQLLVRNKTANQCFDMLHIWLAPGNFESIRNDERFKAVISKLETHAKL